MRKFRGTVLCVALLAVLAMAGPQLAAGATPAWMKAPVLPALTKKDQARLKARVLAGEKLGLRQGVFAKVGDSNTEFSPELYGLACRNPVALPKVLRPTLNRYNRTRIANPRAFDDCLPNTSFSRRSSAAQAGTFSTWSLSPVANLPDDGYWKKPEGCALDTAPLACELDATMPRYALVMLGTNDIGMDIYLDTLPGSQSLTRIRQVIRPILARGVVPVLSTIPPVVWGGPEGQATFDAGVSRVNAAVWKLAKAYGLPMVNLWRAMQQPSMIDQGLSSDGLHLSVFGADGAMVGNFPGPTTMTDSVNFTPAALRYGANRRNLILLKTLARLDKITG